MIRHIIIFAAFFLIGAVVTGAIRTARHDPYGGHQGPHTAVPASGADAHTAMPSRAPDPHVGHGSPATPATVDPHSGHATPAAGAPVNTVCALCGMAVNPAIPAATYQGKSIGFGCKACPPRFAADPERYGPAALKNQVVEE